MSALKRDSDYCQSEIHSAEFGGRKTVEGRTCRNLCILKPNLDFPWREPKRLPLPTGKRPNSTTWSVPKNPTAGDCSSLGLAADCFQQTLPIRPFQRGCLAWNFSQRSPHTAARRGQRSPESRGGVHPQRRPSSRLKIHAPMPIARQSKLGFAIAHPAYPLQTQRAAHCRAATIRAKKLDSPLRLADNRHRGQVAAGMDASSPRGHGRPPCYNPHLLQSLRCAHPIGEIGAPRNCSSVNGPPRAPGTTRGRANC